MKIDLNADLGESRDYALQERLLQVITSANVACGGHAGDGETMRTTLEQCRCLGVAAGAHPSYPDRMNFGRLALNLPPADLAASIAAQVAELMEVARALGVVVTHAKPHGALYNQAARDPAIAAAIVDGLRAYPALVLYGLRGSVMLDVFRDAGFATASEVFADRAYEPDGSLRPRDLPGALLEDPATAAGNALQLALSGADTVCVHSDTPGAVAIARAVRERLTASGFTLGPI